MDSKIPLPAEEEIEQLLNDARAGSADAQGRVLQLAQQYLLGVANRELDDPLRVKAGGSDLVQETFLQAQSIFSRFDGKTLQEMLAWLRGILLKKLAELRRHHLATQKRRLQREVPLDAAGSLRADLIPGRNGHTPSSILGGHEQREAVQRALKRLPQPYRQVIVWRDWEDRSFAEIAQRLDRSADAARMLWWRAIERLEHELDHGQ